MYRGRVYASFTLCSKNSERIFNQRVVVESAIEVLSEELARCEAVNWAYVFMPDHLHLVVEGAAEDADLLTFVTKFKQRTGHLFRKLGLAGSWQPSFYDHVLRSEYELRKHVAYVLDNPVRKGLVEDWRKWPFSGSLSFDIEGVIP